MSEVKPSTDTERLHERATEEIRVLLARRKMSAAELARRAGQKPAALSRRMTGDIAFDLDELQVIARELGVTVVELLGGDSQTTVANLEIADHPLPSLPKVGLPARPLVPTMRRPSRIEMTSSQPEWVA